MRLAWLRNEWLLLCLLVLVGLAPRLAAIRFNVWPHGDVVLDAALADSLALRGQLLIPIVDVRFYAADRFGFGYPPDQHPPLWALLGTVGRLLWTDSYESLKVWSLIAGLALLPAVYLWSKDLLGRRAALFAVALASVSYLLIDFSGNGSLWSLLALLYVLFCWRLAHLGSGERREAVILGLIMGAAYLVNYPAVVLPAVFVSYCLVRRLAPDLTPSPSPRRGGETALALGVMLVVVLPWAAYSTATFGNPIFSQPLQRQLGGSDKLVDLVVTDGGVVKQPRTTAEGLPAIVRRTAVNLYGNIGFLLRQSFVVLPLIGAFALAAGGVLGWRLLRGEVSPLTGVLALAAAHLALILIWPTTKFRYLVPLVPLAVLLGTWFLWQLQPANLRGVLATLTLTLTLTTSVWTFRSVPSRTYYYDGGAVTDNFGGQGEIRWVEEVQRIERAAAVLRSAGPGVVLGTHPFYHLAPGHPLIINSRQYSQTIVEFFVRRYGVQYVWTEQDSVGFYRAFLPIEVLWQDDGFALLRLSSLANTTIAEYDSTSDFHSFRDPTSQEQSGSRPL